MPKKQKMFTKSDDLDIMHIRIKVMTNRFYVLLNMRQIDIKIVQFFIKRGIKLIRECVIYSTGFK